MKFRVYLFYEFLVDMYKQILNFFVNSSLSNRGTYFQHILKFRNTVSDGCLKRLPLRKPSYDCNLNKCFSPVIHKENKKFHDGYFLLATLFGLFQHTKEEEQESELITTIKRAILLIQVIAPCYHLI